MVVFGLGGAVVGHDEDLVEVVAVGEFPLPHFGAVGFSQYPPAVVEVAGGGFGDAVGVVHDFFDPAAQGVVAVGGDVTRVGVGDAGQVVLVIVGVEIAGRVVGQIASEIVGGRGAADSGVFVSDVMGISHVAARTIIECQTVAEGVVGELLVLILK